MLTASGLTKKYGSQTALDGVAFELSPGEVLAVIGPNGAGKTTLIKCLVGLVKFHGKVTIDGIDVAKDGRAARAKIGYLPQNPALHAEMTVSETALFYADLKRVSVGRAREAVEAAGLAEHADKRVGALSGGMRQRLALALALLADPPVLIFDEPVAGLDITARLELRGLVLDQRAAGKAVLLSTHWLEDVPYIADRALVLDRGRTSYLGAAADFASVTAPLSRLYLRLNGRTPDAVGLIEQIAPGGLIDRTGDWLVVSCRASDKARVVEHLVVSGVHVLDFRVEDSPVDGASFRHAEGGR
ncbi:MAG: ABC transporter ATP-binding protein [Anaerolinea sp.]|nr:ABC transporter ATP-binding protein [Anaerolinea sp.]